tara:strand:+ start:524 stop:787 length:264 start_codon:yes stop_codon:yes gene_type:complete
MKIMNRQHRIKKILLKKIINFNIEIVDNSNLHKGHNDFTGIGETHILLKLKPKFDFKINRLELHKQINELLNKEFLNGLHSLEIKII